ncbi:MAG TPA: hypothetical protein VGK59_00860 [Ohtaekwangia sp.]
MRIKFKVLFLLSLVVFSCSKEEQIASSAKRVEADKVFKENVSLLDARIRNLDGAQYVRELVFTDFSDEGAMPISVIMDEIAFMDDGSGNDLVAHDGIYASVNAFAYSSTVKYNASEPIRSMLSAPIISSQFKHLESLREQNKKYNTESGRAQIIEITCEIEFGTTGCNAQVWGWCNSCCVTVYTDTCTVTVGW